jgi:hypothetical protein
MKRQNKGQIRIIEAFLAALIIFSSFAISANLTVTRTTTKNDDLTSVGLQSLLKLDSDGSLGKYIDDGNWNALRDTLNLILPAGISFNLTVYDEQMLQVNNAVISNGAFSSQDITFIEYVCASRSATFHCYTIYLYLAVAE